MGALLGGLKGKGAAAGVMNVGLFTVLPEGAGWANIYMSLRI